jgi:hypothetical protein
MSPVLERRTKLDPAEFIEQYLVPNRPVIVTDAMLDWTLFRTPADLAARFGDDLVQVYNDLFDLVSVTPLRAYLAQHFEQGTASPPPAAVPYVRWYTKMKEVDFVWADDAFRRFAAEWSLPYFLPPSDYLLPACPAAGSVNPNRDLFPGKGLFISARGARTRLHRDPWASDAVLCQVYGTKKILFFSPEREALMPKPGQAANASPIPAGVVPDAEVLLEPGETVLIPRGWFHHADSVTDSISLTWNFVHRSTWPWFFRHITSPAASAELPVLRFFAALK